MSALGRYFPSERKAQMTANAARPSLTEANTEGDVRGHSWVQATDQQSMLEILTLTDLRVL